MRGVFESVRSFVADLMGDSAYQRYVARHAVDHPGHPPMAERDWWRARAKAAEAEVRCC